MLGEGGHQCGPWDSRPGGHMSTCCSCGSVASFNPQPQVEGRVGAWLAVQGPGPPLSKGRASAGPGTARGT